MAIGQRSVAWRVAQSWYVLLTVPFGFTSWLAFLYMGIRAGRARWLLSAAFYFGVLVFIFARGESAGPNGEARIALWTPFAWLGVWVMSMVHAFRTRREFLEILDRQDGGTASAPRREVNDADRTVAPGTSPDFFALFSGASQSSSSPGPAFSEPPPPREEGTRRTSEPAPLAASRTTAPGTSPEFFALFSDPSEPSPPLEAVFPGSEPLESKPPAPRRVPSAPRPPARAAPVAAARPAAPPTVARPAPPAPPALPPPPFSGPAPFGGRRPFDEEGRAARPVPPAPPPRPPRPGRPVDSGPALPALPTGCG